MDELRGKIQNRINLKFFGSNINDLLEKHSSNSISNFEKNCISVYQKAIDYLEQWFDYENSIFKKLNNLNLDYQLDYYKVNELAKDLNIKIDNSNIFDVITLLNNEKDKIMKLLKDQNELEAISQDKIWCKLIQSKKFSSLQKIIECLFAIPISNAYVERVFSIMKNMSDERNSLDINMIKAEICIKLNYSMSCLAFANYVKTNRKLLAAAKSNKKYNFN